MRGIQWIGTAIAVASFGLQAEAKTSWNNPPKRADPSLRHATFRCSALGVPVGYNICLPPEYKEGGSNRFPVIYYLHGYEGSESSYLEYVRYWKQALSRSGPVMLV